MTRDQLEHLIRAAAQIADDQELREKDLEFAREAARHRLIAKDVLRERLDRTELEDEVRAVVEGRVNRIFRPPPPIP